MLISVFYKVGAREAILRYTIFIECYIILRGHTIIKAIIIYQSPGDLTSQPNGARKKMNKF